METRPSSSLRAKDRRRFVRIHLLDRRREQEITVIDELLQWEQFLDEGPRTGLSQKQTARDDTSEKQRLGRRHLVRSFKRGCNQTDAEANCSCQPHVDVVVIWWSSSGPLAPVFGGEG